MLRVRNRPLLDHIQPSKKSLNVIKDRVTELTKRERAIKPLEWIVSEVNATVAKCSVI